MASSKLKAILRKDIGSSACRKLRANQQVPAVVYGHGEEPQHISLPEHALGLVLDSGARLLDVSLGKKKQQLLIKEVQHNHLGTEIVHVDLVRVSMDEKIQLSVPIELRGAVDASSHGGGVVEQHLSELEIECLAVNIPEHIQIAVGKLELGDSIRVKDIEVEEGVTVLSDPEALVISVKIVAAEVSAEEEEAEAVEAAGQEPEIIGRVGEEAQDKDQEE